MEPRWIDGANSPWGFPVFDCRAIATTMSASASNNDVAEQFVALRSSDGSHLFGKRPANAVQIEVDITYPVSLRNLPDRGMIFQAESMGDKWDIALDANVVTFARSCTGEVVYNCNLVRVNDEYRVSAIVVSEDMIDESDVYFHVHVVNFLLYSHVFDVVYPHPLPLTGDMSEDDILLHSFTAYGQRGWFATRERFGEESQ